MKSTRRRVILCEICIVNSFQLQYYKVYVISVNGGFINIVSKVVNRRGVSENRVVHMMVKTK